MYYCSLNPITIFIIIYSYVEIFKGRENISDKEARMVAIFTLKKMIRSWLDETYPNMPEEEKAHRAEIMDISLLEEKKEQNMKSLYEINSVIRMSFIEMQFIKKVRLFQNFQNLSFLAPNLTLSSLYRSF
jgi:hypothetical protein